MLLRDVLCQIFLIHATFVVTSKPANHNCLSITTSASRQFFFFPGKPSTCEVIRNAKGHSKAAIYWTFRRYSQYTNIYKDARPEGLAWLKAQPQNITGTAHNKTIQICTELFLEWVYIQDNDDYQMRREMWKGHKEKVPNVGVIG